MTICYVIFSDNNNRDEYMFEEDESLEVPPLSSLPSNAAKLANTHIPFTYYP
jgi:hypothetical protein